MAQKIEDRAYIQTKVDDILKPMLTKMFVTNPSDPVSFIAHFKSTLTILSIRSNSCKVT